MYNHDEENEENDCSVCGQHGYDCSWPENEKRGKFYYSIPCKLNEPVCQLCVNGDVTTQNLDNEKDSKSINEMSDAEMVIYLRENDLIKCNNCGNIWDGCAQCNCWSNDMYYGSYTNADADADTDTDTEPYAEPEQYTEDPRPEETVNMRNLPPNRPVPVPVPLSLQSLNINNNNEKDNLIKELENKTKS